MEHAQMHYPLNDNDTTAHNNNDKLLHNKFIDNNNGTKNMLFLLSTTLLPFAIQRIGSNDITSNSCNVNNNEASLLTKSTKFHLKKHA